MAAYAAAKKLQWIEMIAISNAACIVPVALPSATSPTCMLPFQPVGAAFACCLSSPLPACVHVCSAAVPQASTPLVLEPFYATMYNSAARIACHMYMRTSLNISSPSGIAGGMHCSFAICSFFLAHFFLAHVVMDMEVYSRPLPWLCPYSWTVNGYKCQMFSNTWVCAMQMYSMPVFDMIEAAFRAWGWTRNKIITRLLMRTLYVAFTCFVAVTLPFFGGNDLAPGVTTLQTLNSKP